MKRRHAGAKRIAHTRRGGTSSRQADPPMQSDDTRAPDRGWMWRAASRARAFWPAKLLAVPACMAAFFAVYFLLLGHPRAAVTPVPLIPADRWVPFWPWALPLYFSLWPYISLAPTLMDRRRELLALLGACVALSAAGFAVFYLWPTRVPDLGMDWSAHPALARLKAVDASGNALPSLHAAFAVLAAATLGRLLRGLGAGPAARALNWLWCTGIVVSTLAIRQHVALDVLAGSLLGAGAAAAQARFLTFLRGGGAIP